MLFLIVDPLVSLYLWFPSLFGNHHFPGGRRHPVHHQSVNVKARLQTRRIQLYLSAGGRRAIKKTVRKGIWFSFLMNQRLILLILQRIHCFPNGFLPTYIIFLGT